MVNWRLVSSELACVALISVREDVIPLVFLPDVEFFSGVQVIAIIRFLGDINQKVSLEIDVIVTAFQFLHSGTITISEFEGIVDGYVRCNMTSGQ